MYYRLSIVGKWLGEYNDLVTAKYAAVGYAAGSGKLVTIWEVKADHYVNVWDTNREDY